MGTVNFKEMYPRRAHVMRPLTKRISKGRKFEWTSDMENAFQKIKSLLSKDTLLIYLRYRKEFTFIRTPLTTK